MNIEHVLKKSESIYKNQFKLIKSKDIRYLNIFDSFTPSDGELFNRYFCIYKKCTQRSGFYTFLGEYLKRSFLKRSIFSSYQFLLLFLVRLGFMPITTIERIFSRKIGRFIGTDLQKVRFFKSKRIECKNILDLRLKIPITTKDIQLNYDYIKSALNNPLVRILQIDIERLILLSFLLSKNDFKKELKAALLQILQVEKDKVILMNIENRFFDIALELLQEIKLSMQNISHIWINIFSYSLHSQYLIDHILEKNKILREQNIEQFSIYLSHNYEDFINGHDGVFSSNFSIDSNCIAILLKLSQNKNLINQLYFEINSEFMISTALELLESEVTFCVSNNLNYPLFRILQKLKYKVCAKNSLFIENVVFNSFNETIRKNYTFKTIQRIKTKSFDIEKNNFLKAFNMRKSINLNNHNSHIEYNFEIFKYETKREISLKNAKSFLPELSNINLGRLNSENVLDFLRNDTQKSNPLENKILIMQMIIKVLQENIEDITATIIDIENAKNELDITSYEYMKNMIFDIIDCFKYYGFEYRMIFDCAKNLELNPKGAIEINIVLHPLELASIIAGNIMCGNITILQNGIYERMFCYIFRDILKICQFLSFEHVDTINTFKIENDNYGKINNIAYVSKYCDIDIFLKEIKCSNISKIYFTQEHDFLEAIPLDFLRSHFNLNEIELFKIDSIRDIELENVSSISIFTIDKDEIEWIKDKSISININYAKDFNIISGLQKVVKSNGFNQIGTKSMLYSLISPQCVSMPRRKIRKEIISAFTKFLSFDEIEFLEQIAHQYLENECFEYKDDNIIIKTNYRSSIVRISQDTELFNVSVYALISFIINNKCLISFESNYFGNKKYSLDSILKELSLQNIKNISLKEQNDNEFLQSLKHYDILISQKDIKNTNCIIFNPVYNKLFDFEIYKNSNFVYFSQEVRVI